MHAIVATSCADVVGAGRTNPLDVNVRPTHNSGMTKLSEWMAATGITDDALAAAVKVDRTTISRVRRGKHLPSIALVRQLVAFSQGQLSSDDLLGLGTESEAA